MKVWLCTTCWRILFRDPEHSCRPVPALRSRLPPEGEKMPAVGVLRLASVRKWCEL